jgi:hypothetical protein
MYERVSQRMRELVRTGEFVVSVDDGLTVLDIEECILHGRIIARQRDRVIGGWKYLVSGSSVCDQPMIVVAKIGPTKKLFVITVYLDQ